MTARDVFKLQAALRDAESRLSDVAADWHATAMSGAPVGTQDYLRGPEAAEVRRLEAEVKDAQAAVGGVVYRIPVENVATLRTKLDKLVKRAAKLDVGEVSYRVTDEVERHEVKIDPLVAMAELGYVPRSTTYRFVVVNAGVVKLAGWMFLATLTVEPGGVMVSKVPGFARAWALHREGAAEGAPHDDGDEVSKAAAATLDSMDLSEYRDEHKATTCDHCGKARRRTKTYLVEHVETGEVKIVGSNCLRDFLGSDPNAVAKYAEYLREVEDSLNDEERGSGGGGERDTDTETYLTHVCTMLRVHGWVPRSAGGHDKPTANAAWENIRSYGKRDRGIAIYDEVTDEDYERALAAREWAREYLGEKKHSGEGLSDFDHNLYVAARGDTVPKKGDGILAYLPVAHARFQEREIERKQRDEKRQETEGSSEWVGREKERITLTGTVTAVFEHAGDYGTTFITKIAGDDGNIYKWFGSYNLGLDARITGKATVKKHDEYKGVKETVVTRPDFRDADAPENVKPKKGETTTFAVKVNDELVEAQVEKVAYGFRVTYQGATEDARRWDQVERAVLSVHYEAQRNAERAAYYAEKLPEGATAKMGSYNPLAMHRPYSESRFVQEGEIVALRRKQDGDFRFDGGDYVPARPADAKEKLSDLVWVPVSLDPPSEHGGISAWATDPDGNRVYLGELEVIVREPVAAGVDDETWARERRGW